MASPLETYQKILAADPRSRVFVELARALLERGDHGRALEVLEAGLVHHPDSALARLLLGRALLGLGRAADAVDALEKAVAASPADRTARDLLERARSQAAPAQADAGGAESPSKTPPLGTLAGDIYQAIAAEAHAPLEATGSVPLATGGPEPPAPVPPAPPLSPPPPLPTLSPPPLPAPPGGQGEGSPLAHLPSEPTPPPASTADKSSSIPLPANPEEAARIAAAYERDLRDKMLAQDQRTAEAGRRRGPAIAFAILALLAAGSAATYHFVRRSHRGQEARTAVAAARAGLARDTHGSLEAAAKALDDARALAPGSGDATALAAEVAALLWTDYADEKALERARALAAAPDVGEGALAARYLTAPGAAERDAAAAAILASAGNGGPLLRVLAGEILRGRGDQDGARLHFGAAAGATPPMLRALALLGDMARADGEQEEALRLYRTALHAHATYPRAVLGAAESHLALGRGLDESLAELEAMARDKQSPPPGPDRLRAELIHARLLFALGRPSEARHDLQQTATRFSGRPEVPMAVAELEMAGGNHDRAEAAAERAVALAPRDEVAREILARARLGRGRYRELLRDTERSSSRAVRLLRAQARVELGEWDQARKELERVRHDGRMPAEAAAWAALVEASAGRTRQAQAFLRALVGPKAKLPVALWAEARLLRAGGKGAAVEKAFRAATAQPGAPVLARVDLAQVVLGNGRPGEAVEMLAPVVEKNPFHVGARLALARARLAAGDARGAASDAARALEDRPRDPEGLVVAGKAAAALGDRATARARLAQAVKVGGPAGAEAKKALAKLPKK